MCKKPNDRIKNTEVSGEKPGNLEKRPDDRTENPGNPEGALGVMTLNRMNESHAPLRKLGFRHVEWRPGMHILDIGCGGGATIAEMLVLSPGSRIDGLDHSWTSVEQTAKLNHAYLDSRLRVIQGDVGALPFEAQVYDLVTAVETVYFWPDMEKAFDGIYRVLKKGGKFLILCDSCDPDVGWPDPFHQITIYLPQQLEAYMEKAGFREIGYEKTKENALCIWGIR